jgi:hypothetical protein
LLDIISIDPAKRACSVTDPATGTVRAMVTSVPGFDAPAEADINAWEYLGGALEAALLSRLYEPFGRPDGWEALRILYRLGSSSGEDVSSEYETINPVLTGLALPGLGLFAPATDLHGALDVVIEYFGDDGLTITPSANWMRIPLHLQMRDVILAAAQQMREAKVAGAPGTPGTPVRPIPG